MSEIKFGDKLPDSVLRNNDNRDVLVALLTCGADHIDGLDQQNYETNTLDQVITAIFVRSNRTIGAKLSYTVGNPSSLAHNGLEGAISVLNQEFFGGNSQEYLDPKTQTPEEFVSRYLHGKMLKYEVNIFKQKEVPRMVDNLNKYAQILAKKNKMELSSLVSQIASLMQSVASKLGTKKEQAKSAEEASAEPTAPVEEATAAPAAPVEEAAPVNNSNPNS